MASKPAMSRAFTHLLPEMSDKPDAGNQVWDLMISCCSSSTNNDSPTHQPCSFAITVHISAVLLTSKSRFSYTHQLFLYTQAMIQQHLLKRAAEQQHRAQAVCSHTQIRGMEQVLDFSDATAQLSASSSDTQKQSSPQKQGVAPVTWTTCDPWFVYMVMTVTVGALAFK